MKKSLKVFAILSGVFFLGLVVCKFIMKLEGLKDKNNLFVEEDDQNSIVLGRSYTKIN
ncbi:hypothetical protein PV797_14650 [Clostridiaceae bacterium M8S5]|nr:hypothetical protein PV797_14650 [Clostridiaceae bacterium M8S5]